MATIPAAYLKAVSDAINSLSSNAQAVALSRLTRIIEASGIDNPFELVDQISDELESLFQALTESSASISATSYDLIRMASLGEGFGAIPYADRDKKWTRKALYGIAKDHRNNMNAFVEGILQRMDYEAKRAAGSTQFKNGYRDPEKPRFARIPTGPETCPFCIMLASRGFVYWSEDTAGKLDHYHANCDCRIVPSYDSYEVTTETGGIRRLSGTTFEGYDPDKYYRGYLDCAKTVFPDREIDRENMLSLPDGVIDAIIREMATRDPAWLRGEVESAEVRCDSSETEAWKTKNKQERAKYKQERKTAKRLAKHGIECIFVVDEKTVIVNGIEKRIGLADLEGGKEIKTLEDAGTYGTIDGHIQNTSGKKNARYLYFDNSQNSAMSDDDLVKHIMKSRRFRRGSIYVYGHDGQLRKIR